MNQSNELFQLINALSKNEKRYFKLFAMSNKRNKSYIHLFDTIAAQKEYDDEAIKARLKVPALVKHFSAAKYYLYHLILKSLRMYHEDDIAEIKLKHYLVEISVLFRKGLFPSCRKHIVKAKKTAELFQYYPEWIKLLEWEARLCANERDYKKMKLVLAELNSVTTRSARLTKQREQLYHYSIYHATNAFAKTSKEKKAYREFIEDPLFNHLDNDASFEEKRATYQLKGFCYRALDDSKQSLFYQEKLVALYESFPDFIIEEPVQYFIAYVNRLMALGESGEHSHVIKEAAQLRERTKKYHSPMNRLTPIIIHSYIIEMEAAVTLARFEHIVSMTDDVRSYLDKNKSLIVRLMSEQSLIYFFLAKGYYATKNYTQAIIYINHASRLARKQNRKDIFLATYMLAMIIHFEKQNFDLVESLLRTVTRILNNDNREYLIERVTLDFLTKAIKDDNEGEYAKLAKESIHKMAPLLKEHQQTSTHEFFNYTIWLESIAYSVSFSEWSVEKAKNN